MPKLTEIHYKLTKKTCH